MTTPTPTPCAMLDELRAALMDRHGTVYWPTRCDLILPAVRGLLRALEERRTMAGSGVLRPHQLEQAICSATSALALAHRQRGVSEGEAHRLAHSVWRAAEEAVALYLLACNPVP